MADMVNRDTATTVPEALTPRLVAGWYRFGRSGEVAEWDGQIWTGATRNDPSAETLPVGRRRRLAFLTHSWFSLFVLGWLVTLGGASLGTVARADHWWWLAVVAVGLAVSLYGFLLIFEPHFHFSQLTDLRMIVIAGVTSGVVASGIAIAVEGPLAERFHESFALELWLSGVVEETSKLFVPVLLWLFIASRFRDPRAGLLTVLISGSTFGVIEGVKYIARDGEHVHLVMAAIRTPTELGHPLWTGTAAALIWLAASRAGRLVTLAGFGGWVLAMALHSVHDGLGSWTVHGAGEPTVAFSTTSTIVSQVAGGNLMTLAWIVASFLILRHVGRELTPPDAVTANPGRWRPEIRQWGIPKVKRNQ